MSLDMFGQIDDTFESVAATRTPTTSDYVLGIATVTLGTPDTSHTVNLQPLNPKEIEFLSAGGEREGDMRKIYVNDGDLFSINPTDLWSFSDPSAPGVFKTIKLDNRPWRNYCKIIVARQDDT